MAEDPSSITDKTKDNILIPKSLAIMSTTTMIKVLLLSLGLSSLTGWQAVVMADETSANCPLPSNTRNLIFDGTLTMKEVVNPNTNTITIQMTYQGEAWVGFGISPEGGMIGADAVIGLPAAGEVVQHDLAGKTVALVTPWETQTISDASVVQENGVTTMSFTMPLANEGQHGIVADGPNTFLYAYGSSNELGFHRSAREFTIDTALQACDPATGTTPDYSEGGSAAASWGVASILTQVVLMATLSFLVL